MPPPPPAAQHSAVAPFSPGGADSSGFGGITTNSLIEFDDMPAGIPPPPRFPPPLDMPSPPESASRWAAPAVDRVYSVEMMPSSERREFAAFAVAPPFPTPTPTTSEVQVTDDYSRGLLSIEDPVELGDYNAIPIIDSGPEVAIAGYEGPHPFWVRGVSGAIVGPLSLDDAQNLLRSECQSGGLDDVSISGNQVAWMEAATYAVLTGQEILVDRWAMKGPPAGTFQDGNVGVLFGKIARDRPSGRLILVDGHDKERRREIIISEGKPTFVYANQKELQLPELLVQRNLISGEQLAEMVHAALVQDQALELVVAERTGVDISRYWAALMRERLIDLFRWESVRYLLDTDSPVTHTTPFAPSFVSLMHELIHRARTG
jgi:hypothetical protein